MKPLNWDEIDYYEQCRMVWQSSADGAIISDTPLTIVLMRGEQKVVEVSINLQELGGKLHGIGIR